ncbi:MAG: polysaccharide biosynthesis tyrosine autokinase [Armatimonadota bacterium]
MHENPATVPETAGFSAQEYIDILRRQRATILAAFVLITAVGAIYSVVQPPMYRAAARLLVAPPSYVINSVTSDPLAPLFMAGSGYSTMTQVEMLQRGEIRAKVAEKLQRKELPAIKVDIVENTSIIQVVAEGDDRALVADAANAMVDVYMTDVKQAATASLRNAMKFAADQEEQARKRADANFKLLSQLKRDNRLPDIETTKTSQQTVVEGLAVAYSSARASAEEAKRRIRVSERKLAEIGPTRSDVPTWQADPAVQQLQTRIDDLDVELKALGEDLGANNPGIVVKARQIAELRGRLVEYKRNFRDRNQRLNPIWRALSDKIIELEIEAQALEGRAATLAEALADATRRLDAIPGLESDYIRYDTEWRSAAERAKYWGDRKREIELRLQTAGQTQNVRDIERAIVPVVPFSPNRTQNLLLAAFIGLFVGLGLGLLRELLDDKIKSPDEARKALGIPSLGQVPLVEEAGLRLIRDISTFSPLSESFRNLRTSLTFAAVGVEMRSLLITSSQPAEGKSTTAANLATTMADSFEGRKVILVDADLRRPSQDKLFRLERAPGLTEVLLGSHSLDDVLRPCGVDNVLVLPAGTLPPNPAELLGSSAMERLIAELESRADFVIFDSPPALAVADSLVLASRVDAALIVVAYGDTRKTMVRKAVEQVSKANRNVLGTVINRMDASAGGYYYYYYNRYYTPSGSVGMLPADTAAKAPAPTVDRQEDGE